MSRGGLNPRQSPPSPALPAEGREEELCAILTTFHKTVLQLGNRLKSLVNTKFAAPDPNPLPRRRGRGDQSKTKENNLSP